MAERGDDRRIFRIPGLLVPQANAEAERDRCLAEESRLHLESLLPVGSTTTINTAPQPEPTPAENAATLGEDSIFLSIVESGLGHAYVEHPQPNWRDIEDAEDVAIANHAGLFSPEHPCTYAAEAARLQERIDQTVADSANAATESAINESIEAIRRTINDAGAWIEQMEDLPRDAGSAIDRMHGTRYVYFTMPLEEGIRAAHIRVSELEQSLRILQPSPAQPVAPSNPGQDESDGFTDLPGYTGPRCYEPGGHTFVPCP